MKSVDLTKLIEGLIAVIGVAIALGQYPALERFARGEAGNALRGWDTHRFFGHSKR